VDDQEVNSQASDCTTRDQSSLTNDAHFLMIGAAVISNGNRTLINGGGQSIHLLDIATLTIGTDEPFLLLLTQPGKPCLRPAGIDASLPATQFRPRHIVDRPDENARAIKQQATRCQTAPAGLHSLDPNQVTTNFGGALWDLSDRIV